jgi:hypothetical protein
MEESTMKKDLKRMVPVCLIVSLFVLTPLQTFAWGGEGHRITARVAWARIRPTTRTKILQILNNNGSLEHASTWPDTLYGNPDNYGYTFHWHFVDIPTNSNHEYKESRDCKQSDEGDCVINAIARERETLKNEGGNANKRRAALRFILHFMGDLHQPLHCAKDSEDEGGNLKPVCFFGTCWESSGKNLNLHKTWDKLMIQRTGLSETNYVDKIVNRINQMSQSEINAILVGVPVNWAEDAHNIALNNAYILPEPQEKYNPKKHKTYYYYMLEQDYHDKNIKHVDEQLLKGALRLAALLDEVLN